MKASKSPSSPFLESCNAWKCERLSDLHVLSQTSISLFRYHLSPTYISDHHRTFSHSVWQIILKSTSSLSSFWEIQQSTTTHHRKLGDKNFQFFPFAFFSLLFFAFRVLFVSASFFLVLSETRTIIAFLGFVSFHKFFHFLSFCVNSFTGFLLFSLQIHKRRRFHSVLAIMGLSSSFAIGRS